MTGTVERINRILGGLVSCQLEFQPAEEINAGEWNSNDISLLTGQQVAELSSERPQFVESELGGQFGFPIMIGDTFAGLAVIKGNFGMKSERLVMLADLLSDVLQSSLMQVERGEETRAVEERLQVLQLTDDDDSNVVAIRPTRLERVREMIKMLEETETRETEVKATTITTPILLEIADSTLLQRVAVDLHEITGRWAMLALEDLGASILESRDGLKELGNITLLVRDVSKLSIEQQTKLAEYLATKPSDEMPLVIAGTSGGDILPRLASQFAVTRATVNDAKAIVSLAVESSRKATAAEATRTANIAPFHAQYFDPDHTTIH